LTRNSDAAVPISTTREARAYQLLSDWPGELVTIALSCAAQIALTPPTEPKPVANNPTQRMGRAGWR